MTKQTLIDDLKKDTIQCIGEYEGENFKYCNEIAKWIKKLLIIKITIGYINPARNGGFFYVL